MFDKILIANRGEIALRIARTARRLGVRIVGVYSDADVDAPHRYFCDEAVHLGESAPGQSYLRTDKIIAACKKIGAEAVHPGYGFLSENADFAAALAAAGIRFIGPRPETIRSMGSKSEAKALMEAAGVPTTPGYWGADQSLEIFAKEAARIGYPVLLKAVAGGGGKGMRRVGSAAELSDAFRSAEREADSSFGDARLLLEKYVERARHLEVQIFGDGKGEVVHMYERDCSIQRRHQKIIEEAPAPNLPVKVRERLLEAGVEAGRAVDYSGAGTVEFLYDEASGQVFFMEMNTRLQVEHPVSEAITGLDFVEWQLRLAAGEDLPLQQAAITSRGHAIEARLYAEDPKGDFAPSTGVITTLRFPGPPCRIDTGIKEGAAVSPHYDPMLAKLIFHGESRSVAARGLRAALANTHVAGLETNSSFLHDVLGAPAFLKAALSTRFIEDHADVLLAQRPLQAKVWAALAAYKRIETRGIGKDPWDSQTGFRLNQPACENLWIDHAQGPALLRLEEASDHGVVQARLYKGVTAAERRAGKATIEVASFTFAIGRVAGGMLHLLVDGTDVAAYVAPHRAGLRIWIAGTYWDIAFADPFARTTDQQQVGSLKSPMPGIVTILSANVGDRVEAGDPLLVMEAMKMEHVVKAPFAGKIVRYRFALGDQVRDGDLLVELEAS